MPISEDEIDRQYQAYLEQQNQPKQGLMNKAPVDALYEFLTGKKVEKPMWDSAKERFTNNIKGSSDLAQTAASQAIDRAKTKAGIQKMGPSLPDSPTPDEQEYTNMITNSVAGASLGNGEKAIINELPVRGDMAAKLMNRAVGLKDASPEIGHRLLDEGLMGSKGTMQKQIQRGFESAVPEYTDAVRNIKNPIDTAPISDAVQKVASQYSLPSGTPQPLRGPEISKISQAASEYNLGKVPASDVDALRKGAGSLGYKPSGDLDPRLMGEVGRAANKASRQALVDAYASSNPGVPNAVDQGLQRLEALTKANKSLPDAGISSLKLEDFLKGKLGLIANKATEIPSLQSYAAQGMAKAAEARDFIKPAIIPQEQTPKVLNDNEEQLYQRYLNSLK